MLIGQLSHHPLPLLYKQVQAVLHCVLVRLQRNKRQPGTDDHLWWPAATLSPTNHWRPVGHTCSSWASQLRMRCSSGTNRRTAASCIHPPSPSPVPLPVLPSTRAQLYPVAPSSRKLHCKISKLYNCTFKQKTSLWNIKTVQIHLQTEAET